MRDVTMNTELSTTERRVSTHTPHAGRDGTVSSDNYIPNFVSTHTPHAGRDVVSITDGINSNWFLLTRPMRDVTKDNIIFM